MKGLCGEYLEKPSNIEFVPKARVYLSHIGAILGDISLIETDISKLPSISDVDAETGRIIVQFLRIAGEPEKALEIAYELVRSHWDEPDAHLALMSFNELGPRQIDFPEFENIKPGVAVKYKEEQTDRIEDAFTREKQIQRWSRAKKNALIEGHREELKKRAKRRPQ